MEKAKILIVDDDPDLTEAMKIVLEYQDYIVKSALSIEQAMERLNTEHPDLIILDVMMKTQQDGFILSRQLKQDDKYKDIPILMLTSVQEKTGIELGSVAGDETWLPVEEFMAKPVKPDVLLEKVEGLLKKA